MFSIQNILQGTLTLLSYTGHMEYEMTSLGGYTYSNFCAVRKFATCPIDAFMNFMHENFDKMQMWQSCVEIEGYSVAYFDHFTAFEAHMISALNGSSAIRRFKHSNAIEIHNGITFDFYTGLPQIIFKAITGNLSLDMMSQT